MQSLIRSKSAGVTGGRGTAGAGPGRDLLYRPSFDGGLGRCTGAVSCGRRHLPLRVGGCHAPLPCVCACACSSWPGRAGWPPGRVLVRVTFSFGRFVFLLCLAPSRLGLPLSWSFLCPPLRLLLFFFRLSVVVSLAPPLSLAFFGLGPRVPWALALCVVCFVGVALLGSPCALASLVLPGRWLLSGGCPAPFCVSLLLPLLGALLFFVFFLFLWAPLLSPAFSGFRPRVPWALALCFVCLGGLRLPGSPCALAWFVCPAWPLASPWWLLPSPPFVSCGFRRCRGGAPFFFSSCVVRPRCLGLSLVSGPGCPGPRRCLFFALLASRFSALCALSPLPCFPPGRWLLPGGCCPPPPFRLAVFVAAARCCVPCAVLCCVSLGVVLRSAAARCAARCCVVVCCVALLRSFGAAACCAVPSGAARRPGALCSAALCFAVFPRAVCSVLCVFCRGVVVRAVVRRSALSYVCPGVLCCAFPVLSALCGAVLRCAGALPLCFPCGVCCCWRLVLWCAAVCFAVSFGVLWCGPGSGSPWWSAGGVLRCRCPRLAAWSASLWFVWLAVVPCFPVSCSVVLCCRVVLCCCALLTCCGAVGACSALLWPVVLCCAVLCCWLAVLFCARWWCLRAVVLFPLCCAFPVFSALCLAVRCCAGCGALLPCVVCCGPVLSRGAVLSCSAVVLRCCLCLLCPPVACRAALCCAVLCCWFSVLFFAWWWRLCAVVPFPSLPACMSSQECTSSV